MGYVMMFCLIVGVAWVVCLIIETCILNPYFKYVKYPKMKKEGYIIKDGYLPYKPEDTIRVKEGYHDPLDPFGFFDSGPSIEMTPYGAQKMLEKMFSERDKYDQCIEKSKRDYKKRHGKDIYRFKENRE